MIKKLLKTMSLETLLDIWEVLAPLKKKYGLLPVRRLVLDEIESRNPDAFDDWLSDDRPFSDLRFTMMEWDYIKKFWR